MELRIMRNMPLLEEDADLSLEALQAFFQANDFSAAVSGYDSDRASSQDKVQDDEEMEQLTQSIQIQGVLTPLVIRP